VPAIGDKWGACDPGNPKNQRLRASILVSHDDTTLLVDTSPDMRQQLLSAGIGELDAVLYTHTHADHIHGIDDLRLINHNMGCAIDVHASKESLEEMGRRFPYVMEPPNPRAKGHFYKPCINAREINGPFTVGPLTVTPFTQGHGFMDSLGFRFDAGDISAAYSTDVMTLDDAAFAILDGVEIWIVDCLQMHPHPTHAHLDLALEWIERVKPRRAVLTHMTNDLDYDAFSEILPSGVEPAYDTMTIEI
jgi:phosphoribosyl 1,2-cyclic phosphate phosphodiesterase